MFIGLGLKEGGYQISVYWHVMGDASDVIEYDRTKTRSVNLMHHST